MKELVFATNNLHKLEEIQAMFDGISGFEGRLRLLRLKDIGFSEEIPETGNTLEGNALEKALFVKDKTGYDCFADDTGLEIEALDGRPGVYSARYAGEACSFDDNIDKVLLEMRGATNRRAKFRTVIALLMEGRECFFEGSVEGVILTERKGIRGFGYDPVFLPDGQARSFAEMDMVEKNSISHRGEALRNLASALKNRIH